MGGWCVGLTTLDTGYYHYVPSLQPSMACLLQLLDALSELVQAFPALPACNWLGSKAHCADVVTTAEGLVLAIGLRVAIEAARSDLVDQTSAINGLQSLPRMTEQDTRSAFAITSTARQITCANSEYC